MTSGADIFESAETAIQFVYKSIRQTYEDNTDTRFGVSFEKFLPDLFRYGGNV